MNITPSERSKLGANIIQEGTPSEKAATAPIESKKAPALSASAATEIVLRSLEDAKAEDIISIDMTGKSALADCMIIASGRSNRHVGAVADAVMRIMKEHHLGTPRIEGLGASDWVLIDQGDVIVHIFRPEVRSFYNLEKLWQMPENPDDAAKSVH